MLKDDDDEKKHGKETLNKMVKFAEFNTSQVINEARLLLQCESPLLEEMTSVVTPNNSSVNSTGLPVNRQINGPLLPAIKNAKTSRKSVRFNMEKNVTFNVQPDIYHSPDSDSESTDENNSDNILGNVRNASDLGITDDESDDDDDDDNDDVERNQTNKTEIITNSDKVTIMGEINDMEKQKIKLAKDLEQLRGRHEKEMKQLREEYRRRREDYYDELDEVQEEMNQRRNEFNVEFSELQDATSLKEKKQRYQEEKKIVEEKEEELQRKKDTILEMEKELKEYEAYLERRHKSLNKKEGDLCVLQDELEELADALKEEEGRLKSKQKSTFNSTKTQACKHDDAEIEKTGILLNNSLRVESEMQEKLKLREEEIEEKNISLSRLQEEKEKLEIKIKHLESQSTLNRPHSPSHYNKKSSLKIITCSIPVDESTGEYMHRSVSRRSLSLDGSNIEGGGILSSPRINKRSTVMSPTVGRHSVRSTKTPLLSDSNENITDKETPMHNDVNKMFDETGIYAADTTLPRISTKSSISKTCSLM